ncbi:MAG: restriction endonuclease subunit S [Verrucomicrobiaceae bacterium]|nr:restriction endonuclease subunit S [Verrucomicrobiaceae bacterium]
MKKGWTTKRLEEVCEIARGGSPRPIEKFLTTAPDGINWVKIGDATASDKYIYKTEEKITSDGVKRSRMVHDGDFLLSNSMSFGRPYIMKTSGCIHDGWLVLRQREKQLEQDFLFYLLSSDELFQQFDRLAAGSTVRNLNIGLVKSVEISFPPLAEQQRIVGVLDEAFVGLATAQAHAAQNLQNARALFESHLQSVFTHRGKGWVEKTLGETCEMYQPKTIGTKDLVPDGPYPVFGANGIIGRYDKFNHEEPQLLITCRGATCGAVNISEPKSWITGNAMVVRPLDASLDLGFLEYAFRGGIDISKAITGAAQPQITRTNLSPLLICFPKSVTEQKQLASTFRDLAAETQRLTRLYEQKQAALAALKKSLLHQAFTGEL